MTAASTAAEAPETLASLTASLNAAKACNDLPATIRIASRLRGNYPASVDGYRLGAFALRQSGRCDEAASILLEAAITTEETLWLRMEWVELARQRGDWADVAKHARLLRERFPNDTIGWRVGFATCRQLGDFEGGDIILQDVMPRVRSAEWALEGAALVAASRGDWAGTRACSEALRLAFPANEHGYRLGLRSLRHLRRFDPMATLAATAQEKFLGKTWLLMEQAYLAQAGSDLPRAGRLWRQLRDISPNLMEGYTGGIRASLAQRQFDDADAVCAQAAACFPNAAWPLAQQAEIAAAQGKSPYSAELWASLRRTHPEAREGYHGSYRHFRALGQFQEAEAVLEAALTRFPLDRWALTELALLEKAKMDFTAAEQRWLRAATALPDDQEIALRYALARSQDVPVDHRDWTTTRSRLRELNERFPVYVLGWLEHIKTIRFMGADEEAAELARACLQTFSDETTLWLEYAKATADDTGRTAAERLAQAAIRLPEDQMVHTAFVEALGQAGRMQEAESAYQQAIQRFGNSADLLCGYAALAMRRNDWSEALQRWQNARARYPNDARVSVGTLDTLAALEEAQEGALQAENCMPVAGTVQLERVELLAAFESLGGTGQGCEFGFVQRAGGVESLGLLRWMHITPAALTSGLLDRFEGVGSPEQTVVDFFRGEDPENPEYRYRDNRLDARMHTFVRKKEVPEAAMFKQTCRRVGFLRRKFIQDLEEARKIFVYKIYERTLNPSELAGLHNAIRSYGENTLLYVCYANSEHPSGTVKEAGRGLLIGYISGFNVCRETHMIRAPDLPAWHAICRAAYAVHCSQSG